MILDTKGADCRVCGEPIEPGDENVKAVWSGDVDEDDEFSGDALDFYHGDCVSIDDNRPPVAYTLDYENADGDVTTHFMNGHLVGDNFDERIFTSLCGRINQISEGVEKSRMRPLLVDSKEDGTCSVCANKWRSVKL